MSFDSKVLFLDPKIYFPMDDRVAFRPVDIISGAESDVFGERPTFFSAEGFLTDVCRVPDGSSIQFSASEAFPYSSYSYGVWFRTEDSDANILHVRDFVSGAGIDVRAGDLIFYHSGAQEVTVGEVSPDTIHLVCFSYDGDNVSLYLDGEFIDDYSHTPPGVDFGILGGGISEETDGTTDFTGLFALDYSLTPSQVKDIYDSGTIGRTQRLVDGQSSFAVSDKKVDTFQTSWQAYGIVVVKE